MSNEYSYLINIIKMFKNNSLENMKHESTLENYFLY